MSWEFVVHMTTPPPSSQPEMVQPFWMIISLIDDYHSDWTHQPILAPLLCILAYFFSFHQIFSSLSHWSSSEPLLLLASSLLFPLGIHPLSGPSLLSPWSHCLYLGASLSWQRKEIILYLSGFSCYIQTWQVIVILSSHSVCNWYRGEDIVLALDLLIQFGHQSVGDRQWRDSIQSPAISTTLSWSWTQTKVFDH